jgi:hypothetical protein
MIAPRMRIQNKQIATRVIIAKSTILFFKKLKRMEIRESENFKQIKTTNGKSKKRKCKTEISRYYIEYRIMGQNSADSKKTTVKKVSHNSRASTQTDPKTGTPDE